MTSWLWNHSVIAGIRLMKIIFAKNVAANVIVLSSLVPIHNHFQWSKD